MDQSDKVPPKAWVVIGAGMAVNLCLGILYAWSVWKANLVADSSHPAGSPMTGLNVGWSYLTDAQATWAYALCGLIFALVMIPGGRIQDRYGPRLGATLGGLFLAGGSILAGLMRSYTGLLLGFGVLGGIGMGLGYAAATPAAVKWFGPHRRGLVVGLVVAGYGGAAIYIAPLAKYLIAHYGLSGSFLGLGTLFAVVVVVAGRLLTSPSPGYVPPGSPASTPASSALTVVDWSARDMLRTWQFYGLVFLFLGSAQSGLLIIANATPMLNQTASTLAFFAANAWMLASFGGLVNATGRVGTGLYSDRIGRQQRLSGQRRRLGGLPVPDAEHHGLGQRAAAVPGRRRGLLAIWRRAGADAGLHGGLLRPEEPGIQLRVGLPRLGSRVLRAATGRVHQGCDRQPGYPVLRLRWPAGGRGVPQSFPAPPAGTDRA